MTGGRIVACAAVLGALGVALGAFGAHGLRGRVSPHLLEVYETAVRYHLVHALALLATGIWADRLSPPGSALVAAAVCFGVGVALFSGSLYVLVLTGRGWLGAITPLGGLSFVAGWLLLARAAWTR